MTKCVVCGRETEDWFFNTCNECHGEEINAMIEEDRREPPDSEFTTNSEESKDDT